MNATSATPLRARLARLLSRQSAALTCVVAASVTLVLAGLRIAYGISLSGPGLQLASGLEEEALFSIWSTVHGEGTYRDILDVPFSHSYFNWLFYIAYAGVVKIALLGHPNADIWIPTITHVTTLLVSAVGAMVFALFLRRQLPGTVLEQTGVSVAAASLAFFGPLAGFWVISARPDLAALALEVSAFVYGARYFQLGASRDLWVAVVLSLAAWSFKQTSVVVFGSLIVSLLVQQQWRKAIVLGVSMMACAGLPFLLYGEKYFINAYLINTAARLLVEHGIENLGISFLKAPVIPFAIVLLGTILITDRKRLAKAATAFELVTFLMSTLFALLTGAKGGASQNYFFLPGCLAVWWLVAIQFRYHADSVGANRVVCGMFIAAMLLQSLSAAAILAGHAGRIDISGDGEYLEYLRRSLPARTPPVLVLTRSGNLPWIQSVAPHFVFGYLYDMPMVRQLGYRFNGLEGLVQSGYINTVVVPKQVPPDLSIQVPGAMTMVAEDKYFRYFSR